MRYRSTAAVTAIGSYAPERILTNADLERMVETSDEWIVRRTGIRERRIAAPDQYASDLAIAAVRELQRRYAQPLDDVDGVIVATTTPDTPFPSVAARVQRALGVRSCLTFDLNAACAGFVYGLQTANGLILSGAHRKVLVIGADTITKITDYTDRSTCILFGDGAGAVLVEAAEEGAFLASYARTDGDGGHHVYCAGLSDQWDGRPLAGGGKLVQNGPEVYRWAVSTVPDAMRRMVREAGLAFETLDWFVPHSANLRMIETICERLDFPAARALQSVEYGGNTSAASIPLALDAAVRDGRVQAGHTLALFGFGSGLTQAGLVLRWTAAAPQSSSEASPDASE